MFDQVSFFDAPHYKIDKPIRLIELFAGIGSQAKALRNIGADYEHYRICEFDEYAVKSYNAIHGTEFKKSDVTQITAEDLGIVDKDKYCYIMTYSFPCQDLSVAGKGKGMAKDSGTRSGLLWEVERLLDECTDLPQILLMENVTQVHGQKNIRHFRDWLVKLESLGYRNYFQDLNAKGFEVPQNRDRTFMVSILGEFTYKFPTPRPLTLRLKDVLEEKVDEKYYLSENTIGFWEANSKKQEENGNGFRFTPSDGSGIAKTILTRPGNRMDDNYIEEPQITVLGNYMPSGHDASRIVDPDGIAPTVKENHGTVTAIVEPEVKQIGNLFPSKTRDNPNRGRLYDTEGIAPTLDTMQGGNRQPFITVDAEKGVFIVPENNKKGYAEADEGDTINISYRTSKTRRGRVGKGVAQTIMACQEEQVVVVSEPLALDEQNGYIREDGTVGCLTTDGSSPKHNNRVIEGNKRIRKLTPRECYRLMGFTDEDFDKASAVNSDTQLYKQAGNSICVPVLEAIFKQFF